MPTCTSLDQMTWHTHKKQQHRDVKLYGLKQSYTSDIECWNPRVLFSAESSHYPVFRPTAEGHGFGLQWKEFFIESTKSHIGFFSSFLLFFCGVLRHPDNPDTDLSRPPAFKEIDTSEQNQHEQCQGICLYRPWTSIQKVDRIGGLRDFFLHRRVYLLFKNKWDFRWQWCFNIKSSIKKV